MGGEVEFLVAIVAGLFWLIVVAYLFEFTKKQREANRQIVALLSAMTAELRKLNERAPTSTASSSAQESTTPAPPASPAKAGVYRI